VGGARGRAPVQHDGRGDGGRHPARRGVGVGVLLPPVIGGEGLPLPPPGRPHRAPCAGGVGYSGECFSSREHPDPRLGASGLLCPDADVVVGDGGALRVPCEDARAVAYLGTALLRGDSTPAAAILSTQWVLEVAGVRYASARNQMVPVASGPQLGGQPRGAAPHQRGGGGEP